MPVIARDSFFVVTGGPGAGKTTLIERLAAQGFATVEEAGRRIIREQKASGGNATHDGDRLAYRALMFRDAIATYELHCLSACALNQCGPGVKLSLR